MKKLAIIALLLQGCAATQTPTQSGSGTSVTLATSGYRTAPRPTTYVQWDLTINPLTGMGEGGPRHE